MTSYKIFTLHKNGETAIHYCCRCNNIEASKRVIDYLIKNNVSLNVQNKVKYSSTYLLLYAFN